MNTQLNRVLSVLSDGQWHSLSNISQKLFIKRRSVSSRIRDLRLTVYGNHSIEVRKTPRRQVYEYRLMAQNTTPNPAIGNISVETMPTIKFLNTQSMDVKHHPRNQCEMRVVGGFPRLVALDSLGQVIMHYVTPQNTF